MTSRPLVTIGIPTCNRPEFLDACLASISSYSYASLEVIISENSPDCATDKIVESYPQLNVRYFRQPKNIGIVDNFSFVLNKASGIFFFFHADDDSYHPSFVQDAVEFFSVHPGAVSFFGATLISSRASSGTREVRVPLRQPPGNSLRSDVTTLWSVNNVMNLALPNKSNYLIYAIHRTSVLTNIWNSLVNLCANERDLVSSLALSGEIGISKAFYFYRLVHDQCEGVTSSLSKAIVKALFCSQHLSPVEKVRLRRLSPISAMRIATHLASLRPRGTLRLSIFFIMIYYRNLSLVILELLREARSTFRSFF